jgi:hypothetical protein
MYRERIAVALSWPGEVVVTWLLILLGGSHRLKRGTYLVSDLEDDFEAGQLQAYSSMLPGVVYLSPMVWIVTYDSMLSPTQRLAAYLILVPLTTAFGASWLWYETEIEERGVGV